MNSVLGAQATEQRQGFMKALIGKNDDRFLGFTMIGAEAGEVMARCRIAIQIVCILDRVNVHARFSHHS
jgi:pyruvate/2-oxoglutarate dehydrogenase complex dihydrolipoamide dehydrogenase (E3) component